MPTVSGVNLQHIILQHAYGKNDDTYNVKKIVTYLSEYTLLIIYYCVSFRHVIATYCRIKSN